MNEKVETIKVLVIRPGEKPVIEDIEHTLKGMQNIVGGPIQDFSTYKDDVAFICCATGKQQNFTANRARINDEGKVFDIIAGTFFVCGISETGFESIPDDLIKKYMDKYEYPDHFRWTPDGKLFCLNLRPGAEPIYVCG